jgi:ParB-like chromosome segregation protein Spo0J
MPGQRDVKFIAVRSLKRSKHNPRTHSKRQVAQIASSIRQWGWTIPILADEDNRILAGHGRADAAELLGIRRVPVIVISGLGEAEKRALALADNKIATNAGWDRPILAIARSS